MKLDNSKFVKECGGGYGISDEKTIVIDSDLSREKKILTIIHEVLHMHLQKRVKHSTMDNIAIDIVDSLQQLKIL